MNKLLRWYFLILFAFFSSVGGAQEISFFSEGTDETFYDQGIINVGSMGESSFENTHPPGLPQYNDKIPCSTNAWEGNTSLKFNYTSAENGNWRITIYRKDWSTADITGLDTLSFYVFSEELLPKSALPLIGLTAPNNDFTGDLFSSFYKLSDYNGDVPANQWIRIVFPLNVITDDNDNNLLNFSSVKGVVFRQSETNGTSRLILIDEISAYRSLTEIPAVKNLLATGFDSHAELNWDFPTEDLTYRVYASLDGGLNFELRAETSENYYLDFVPEQARNSEVFYRVVSVLQGNESEPAEESAQIRDFSDNELMDMVQRYTFRYFWEGAHQTTGMILERSNGNSQTVASGATGMGLMALILGHEREYRPQEEIKDRVLMILEFLTNCERHHGAWSHWYNANTYATRPFSEKDDGGDIVETSYVAASLIALKNYFSGSDNKSTVIRERANQLWREIEWTWYRNGQNTLYWHWSPNFSFEMNMQVRGWNEALITYIMAAASPTHGIPKVVYDQGWARNGNMVNPRTFYGQEISLAPDYGGPLFFIHYTHLGINPYGLSNEYANYWQEHVNTAKIHHAYAVDNPLNHESYSDSCWGLTASDDPDGYTAHRPWFNDNGTVSPTAALGSMPYTPGETMKALKYFYRERGADLFGKYGFYDAFNDNRDWVAESYLGIDQGPIVVMLENHRTGLLWNNVMKDDEVKAGLDKLGFNYQVSTDASEVAEVGLFKVYPNPAGNHFYIDLNSSFRQKNVNLKIIGLDGELILNKEVVSPTSSLKVDCSEIDTGFYIVNISTGEKTMNTKLLIQNK